MAGAFPVTLVVAEFTVRVAFALVILLRSRSTPAVRLAWLVLVFAVPVLGVIAYLLVGDAIALALFWLLGLPFRGKRTASGGGTD